MEPALKQRLIGAAVLVALAVIFLPILLEGPQPETAGGAVSLDMPAPPPRDREVREIPLNLPVVPSANAPAPSTPAEVLPTVDTTDAASAPPADGPTPDGSLPPAPSAAEPAPRAGTEARPQPAPALAEPVAERPEPAAAVVPPASPDAQAPVTAALPPAADAPAATAPAATRAGGYVVNLGVFAQAANAQALSRRLQQAGIPVLSEHMALDGKSATRLRAGPYATRAEAERARLLIGQTVDGVQGSVVALDPEPTQDAPADAIDARAAGWAVQVGAFAAEADALALRERLRGGGHPAFVERVPTDKGELFRVRVGPELRRPAADALKVALKQAFGLDGIVVPHP